MGKLRDRCNYSSFESKLLLVEIRNVQQRWDENEERKLVYFIFLASLFGQMAFAFKSHQLSFFQ